jgi:ribosomal protein S27E
MKNQDDLHSLVKKKSNEYEWRSAREEQSKQEAVKKEIQSLQNFEKAGRYEEAAEGYEALQMWEKAGECRRMAKTTYVISSSFQIGKDGGIRVACPHCGASQALEAKSNEVTCKFCGTRYIVPKKILDMI